MRVRQAREATAALPGVEVREADIRALDLPDASVDRVHTDRVLQHVPEPGTAMAEARRVLRPGGTAVFAEPDWDTLIIDYPDPAIARAYTRYIADHVVRNATIGRALPRLATDAGFLVEMVIPITAVFRDAQAADQVLGLQRVTEQGRSGAVPDRRLGQPMAFLPGHAAILRVGYDLHHHSVCWIGRLARWR